MESIYMVKLMENRQIRSELFKLESEALYFLFEIHSPIYEHSLPSVCPQALCRKKKIKSL
jgi:hypothetical protein